ncbi:MAG TPA: hypothetical protein EYN06_03790 [Myxococcales bacterium]|nr:hypothetical protein [Myxococcales bacterium]HIN85581.1 hypothetical protein [Myxococcales bacterium]
MNEWVKRLALVIVSPLILLVTLEYVLWVFDVEPPAVVEKVRVGDGPGDDPDAFHSKMSSEITTGRLICLGGSTVAGTPFEYEMSLCTLVGDAMGKQTEVHNLAGSGMDSSDVLMLGKMACDHPQSLIVVYSGHNEFLNLHRYAKNIPVVLSATATFFRKFRFYRLISKYLVSKPERISQVGESDLSDEQVYKLYERNIEELIEHCKGQPLVFATVVSNRDFRFPEPGRTIRAGNRRAGRSASQSMNSTCRHCFRAGPQINAVIRRLGQKYGIPVVDSEKLVSGKNHMELFWDHVHPKPALHEKLARAILDQAKSKGLIKTFQPPKHNLSSNKILWAREERAFYNAQFDPTIALKQLRELHPENKSITQAIVISICAFLLDDLDSFRTAIQNAAKLLEADPAARREWGACAGLQGGGSQRGAGGGPSCQLPCMPWCSTTLMSAQERDELVVLTRAIGVPILTRLMEEF